MTTKNNTNIDVRGELTFNDKVLEKVVAFSLRKVDGLLSVDGGFLSNLTEKFVSSENSTSGINVEVGKTQVAVDMSVVVEYGKDVEKMYNDIKKIAYNEIKRNTSLELIELNVVVVDIKTKEEFEKESRTIVDRVDQGIKGSGEFISEKSTQVKDSFSKDEVEARVE